MEAVGNRFSCLFPTTEEIIAQDLSESCPHADKKIIQAVAAAFEYKFLGNGCVKAAVQLTLKGLNLNLSDELITDLSNALSSRSSWVLLPRLQSMP